MPVFKQVDTSEYSVRKSKYIPRVAVLMSTYNGERYLREQIDSIAAQRDVEVFLWVRDDGSCDETRALLLEFSKKPRGSILSWKVEMGDNRGFLGSFENLLTGAEGCDFYAFSDQDDYWFPEKLTKAIVAL